MPYRKRKRGAKSGRKNRSFCSSTDKCIKYRSITLSPFVTYVEEVDDQHISNLASYEIDNPDNNEEGAINDTTIDSDEHEQHGDTTNTNTNSNTDTAIDAAATFTKENEDADVGMESKTVDDNQVPLSLDCPEDDDNRDISNDDEPLSIPGWRKFVHVTGLPIYYHTETLHFTTCEPYCLKGKTARTHLIQKSSIPCYRPKSSSDGDDPMRGENREEKLLVRREVDGNNVVTMMTTTTSAVASSCCTIAHSSPTTTTMATSPAPPTSCSAIAADGTKCTQSSNDVADDDDRLKLSKDDSEDECRKELAAIRKNNGEIFDYYKSGSLFSFQTLKFMKFKSWNVRRTYTRALRREIIRKYRKSNAASLSIPIYKLDNRTGKTIKEDWYINPKEKSFISILHQYIQQTLKTQPVYKFRELESSKTPFSATIVINDTEYGIGVGRNKKEAKIMAAKNTMEVLLPAECKNAIEAAYRLSVGRVAYNTGGSTAAIRAGGCNENSETTQRQSETSNNNHHHNNGNNGNNERQNSIDVASVFDRIAVTDPNVTEFSLQTSVPTPFEILQRCVRCKYGDADTSKNTDGSGSSPQIDYTVNGDQCTMSVGEHTVTVTCVKRRKSKQMAAQALLESLHPYIGNWGALLRLYGDNNLRDEMKNEHHGTISVPVDTAYVDHGPNLQLMATLKSRMLTLAEKLDKQKSNEQDKG